jgi:hypothetical protein
MNDALSLLALPFAASVAFVLYTYLGVHVLRRKSFCRPRAGSAFGAGCDRTRRWQHSPTGPRASVYALLFWRSARRC